MRYLLGPPRFEELRYEAEQIVPVMLKPANK
jgi:hypothetical protein